MVSIINGVKLNYNEEKNYNYEVSVLVRTSVRSLKEIKHG